MLEFSWHDAYYSDLQSLYALLVVPLAFLAWRAASSASARSGVVPAAAPFVSALTLVFAIETMLDPIATGPLLKLDAVRGTFVATVVPFVFVLLGDLRVLLLALGVARPEAGLRSHLQQALALSLIVPIVAGSSYALASWIWPDIHGQALWMIYEFGFFMLCVVLGRRWTSEHAPTDPGKAAFLGSLFGYSAAYYALWLTADIVIVIGGLDLGWALRMVPNQLYYAFWVPFIYWRFFATAPIALPSVSESNAAR